MLSHKEMVKGVEGGRLSLLTEPAVARQFYTNFDESQQIEAVGDSQSYESMTVKSFYLTAPLAFSIAAISSVFAFRYWAFLIIPSLALFYVASQSFASIKKPSFIPSILLIAVAWFFAFYFRHMGNAFVLTLTLAPLPHLLFRVVYRLSTLFLSSLVESNPRAYEFFTHYKGPKSSLPAVMVRDRTNGKILD